MTTARFGTRMLNQQTSQIGNSRSGSDEVARVLTIVQRGIVLCPIVASLLVGVSKRISFARLREGAKTKRLASCKCPLQNEPHEIPATPAPAGCHTHSRLVRMSGLFGGLVNHEVRNSGSERRSVCDKWRFVGAIRNVSIRREIPGAEAPARRVG